MKIPVLGGVVTALSVALLSNCWWGNELGNLESIQHGTVSDPVPRQAYDAELVAACGDGKVTSEGEAAFLRWPYLQKVTDRGLSILWTTAAGEPAAEVRVTTIDGAPVATLEATPDPQSARDGHTQYATAIDGLEPDTIYCYEIAGDSVWLEPTGFRTAPVTGSLAEVKVLVIGDVGTRTSDQLAVRDQMMKVPFDLVLVAGDLAYEKGTLADHERNFFDVYRELMLKKPFFVISGNHDYDNDGAVFREVFALFENGGPDGVERWYSLDWGPLHVTAIDTQKLGAPQAAWAEKDAAASEQPWKLALMHRPAFSSGHHGSNGSVQLLFVPIFERYDYDLVLAGHDHNYERTRAINGVTYVVTGSAGRGTRPVGASSFTAYSEAVAHFTHITATAGGLKINAVDAAGGDFDMAYIE